ncbi:ADP-ribosylglycohydrolase family protein [Micromonospora terminaliae]|uniref:ADP-ribosylglycohydrolase family protein n=1 Tax=Micromonospora terminaliae TaxID=1914461 RepID=A0AAJ3DJT7_9ACTN|nr:ADP-ribosylglycohydrolase family protein [Micromonospora terminaliae]NES28623.1 ADP-ribosylglycohydrolase family protein [Micromonospora terminaliae]QGL45656.1 ADP-ribosylglycohydrolase family protein [Micromonospora terminaliae]
MITCVIDSAPRRASGSLFGLAYGDALGKPTEFLTVAEIVRRYGPAGPRELTGDPALVTDDTQMALAVAWALHDAPSLTADAVEPLLRRRFLDWAVSPDNNRAPGMTCLRACAELDRGTRWQEATVAGSKGCGANMRVTPVGLLDVDLDTLAGLAQLQAGLTHGHPTGLAASELTAYAVRLLRDGAALPEVPGLLTDRAREQRTVYRGDWLGDLWQRPGESTPGEFMARGWDDCLRVLGRLDAALARPDDGGDPCRLTGEGWIAEEALATALLCALRHPDDPVGALARGATTAGDSDSIAALAGAFLGAAHGMAAWPAEWSTRIEYADQLTALSTPLD